MPINIKVRSFSGGEWSPNLYQRNDLAKYATACQIMKNFIPDPQGGASNRAGLHFIYPTKLGSTRKGRLIPFVFSVVQAYILEFGHNYIRVYKDDGIVLSGGTPYEITTTYTEDQLFDLKFEQSADVLYIVHPAHPPRKLSRTSHSSWTLTAITFGATLAAPTGLSTGSAGSSSYAVTAYSNTTKEESLISNIVASNDAATLTWNRVTGATKYNIYKLVDSIWGFRAVVGDPGSGSTVSYVMTAASPDMAKSPPTAQNYFPSTDNYPACAAFFQQRLWYARTNNKPQTMYGSSSGSFDNFNLSQPTVDSDGLSFTINSTQVNEIKHLLPLTKAMIAFTSGAEYAVSGANDAAITPTNVLVEPQSSWGCGSVKPMRVGQSAIFVDRSNRRVRDMAYQIAFEAYTNNETSIFSQHLFDSGYIVDWCYQQYPNPIIWIVTSDGRLIGLSYSVDRDQIVSAFHRHETQGFFESCASIPNTDGTTDIYFIVRRVINGATVRYVEKFNKRNFTSIEDAFFVDSGLYQSFGSPVTSISGLSHLEGAEVIILADGNVVRNKTVSGGSVTLTKAASKVSVGLEYNCQLKPMKFVLDLQSGTTENLTGQIPSAAVRFKDTRSLKIGPNENDEAFEYQFRNEEGWGEATQLFNGSKEINIGHGNKKDMTIYFLVDNPVPCTILDATPRLAYGKR